MSSIIARLNPTGVSFEFVEPTHDEACLVASRIGAALETQGFVWPWGPPTDLSEGRGVRVFYGSRNGYGMGIGLTYRPSFLVAAGSPAIRIEVGHRLANLADAAERRLAPWGLLEDVAGRTRDAARWDFADPADESAFAALAARLLGGVRAAHPSLALRPGLAHLLTDHGIVRP